MSKEITLPKQQATEGDPCLHIVSQKKYSSGQQSASDGGSDRGTGIRDIT